MAAEDTASQAAQTPLHSDGAEQKDVLRIIAEVERSLLLLHVPEPLLVHHLAAVGAEDVDRAIPRS